MKIAQAQSPTSLRWLLPTRLNLGGSAYAAIDCAAPPTCDELGYAYSADWCKDQAVLKCPFDNAKVFCGEPKDPDPSVTCTVGAILYNDLKCYDEVPSGKTAIGVVFNTSKRLAIALNHKGSISWGGHGTDIPGLNNCAPDLYKNCDRFSSGKENTATIVAALGSSSSLAAGYCSTNTTGKLMQGTWFLPTISELITLYENGTTINAAMTAAGGTKIPTSNAWYWSSTEYSSNDALLLYMSNGRVSYDSKLNSNSKYYARCAVAY